MRLQNIFLGRIMVWCWCWVTLDESIWPSVNRFLCCSCSFRAI